MVGGGGGISNLSDVPAVIWIYMFPVTTTMNKTKMQHSDQVCVVCVCVCVMKVSSIQVLTNHFSEN